MSGFLDNLMDLFGFTEHQSVIAVISLLFFCLSFMGGMFAGMATAMGGPRPPHKLMDKMSIRMMLMAEILLLLWIGYYHTILISEFNQSHAVYWVSTMISGPILGMIGIEITSAIFAEKIRENQKQYKAFVRRQRAERAKLNRDKEHGAGARAATAPSSRKAPPAGGRHPTKARPKRR